MRQLCCIQHNNPSQTSHNSCEGNSEDPTGRNMAFVFSGPSESRLRTPNAAPNKASGHTDQLSWRFSETLNLFSMNSMKSQHMAWISKMDMNWNSPSWVFWQGSKADVLLETCCDSPPLFSSLHLVYSTLGLIKTSTLFGWDWALRLCLLYVNCLGSRDPTPHCNISLSVSLCLSFSVLNNWENIPDYTGAHFKFEKISRLRLKPNLRQQHT